MDAGLIEPTVYVAIHQSDLLYCLAEESDVVLQPVQSRGKSALLADGQALVEIADAASIVFYNETYRRKAP